MAGSAEDNFKEVRFDQYCPTCKNRDCAVGEYSGVTYDDASTAKSIPNCPCDDCLETSAQLYSHKPVNYEKEN